MAIVSLKRRKRRARRRRPAAKRPALPVATPVAKPTPPDAPVPITPAVQTPVATSRERLFLNRLGAGFTQSALAELRNAGTPEAWLEAQLSPGAVTEAAKVADIDGWFDSLWRTPAQKYSTDRAKTRSAWDYGNDLGNWSILRRIYSRRTVLETMADFWSTNLHIPVGHDRAWVWRFDYDRTIRTHALGRFEDLLRACSLHPAMRFYLDNWKSVKDKPNENQGRELLELHTVGVGAGYSEAMVKASAVLLSGYTVDWGTSFEPRYDTAKHTTGSVQVLDFTHANTSADGQAATTAYLSYLAHHPATARNVARKIATYFVSDAPSDGLVESLALTYLDNDTDIKAVLRALTSHPEFLTSEGRKVRTPIADLVATARVLDVDVQAPQVDGAYAQHANWTHGGAALFSWPRPDGSPVVGSAWSSASRLFSSCEMHQNHAGGWWPKGATYRAPASWLPAPTVRFDAYVDHLCRTWLGRAADARLQEAAVRAVTGPESWAVVTPTSTITAKHNLGSWLFPPLVSALLDTPDHLTT